MKKILAMALALVMTFGLSVNALAVEITNDVAPDNVAEGDVTVTVNEGVDAGIVYSVTVEWTDTEVIYQKAGEGRWNPETHEYVGATQDGWTNNTAEVKVTNHSNAAVAAVVENSVNNTGVSYALDPAEFNLATAENTAVEEAPSQTVTITAEGTPTAGSDTFTVTIAAYVEPVELEKYTVYLSDRWESDSQQTEFEDVQVNQEIEFFITNYAEEMYGNSDAYAYLSNATVSEGEAANMALVDAEHGYNIKFTAAGTYSVSADFKTIGGDSAYMTAVPLTFTVSE